MRVVSEKNFDRDLIVTDPVTSFRRGAGMTGNDADMGKIWNLSASGVSMGTELRLQFGRSW